MLIPTWLAWIIIGILAGFIASKIVDKSGKGLLVDLLLGIVGALIGGWLFGVMGIVAGGWIGSLVTATVGAIVLLLIVRLIRRL